MWLKKNTYTYTLKPYFIHYSLDHQTRTEEHVAKTEDTNHSKLLTIELRREILATYQNYKSTVPSAVLFKGICVFYSQNLQIINRNL